MLKKSTKQLRAALDAAIMGYIRKFEEVHGVRVEYAVGDDLLGIFEVSDAFIRLDDIVYDIDNKCSVGLIFEWYWAGLEAYELKSEQKINLQSYAMGARFEHQNAIP